MKSVLVFSCIITFPLCLTLKLLQLPEKDCFPDYLQRAMDEGILPFSSDDDTRDAADLDPSYDTCPEDIKLSVR
jgi:hypothetical protein